MILYHYTTPLHLESIGRDGFLKVTESNIGAPEGKGMEPCGEHHGPDVVWLTDKDSTTCNRDTLRAGLKLVSVMPVPAQIDKSVIRFMVEVPDDEVVTWEPFAKEHGIHSRWKRTLEKNYARPRWWFLVQRPIPSEEWRRIEATYGECDPCEYAPDLEPWVPKVEWTLLDG